MGKRRDKNVHHILGQVYREKYRINLPQNKIVVDVAKHQALNRLVDCKQSPKEQLAILFLEWRNPVLSDKIRENLFKVLNTPDEEFYIEEIYR